MKVIILAFYGKVGNNARRVLLKRGKGPSRCTRRCLCHVMQVCGLTFERVCANGCSSLVQCVP